MFYLWVPPGAQEIGSSLSNTRPYRVFPERNFDFSSRHTYNLDIKKIEIQYQILIYLINSRKIPYAISYQNCTQYQDPIVMHANFRHLPLALNSQEVWPQMTEDLKQCFKFSFLSPAHNCKNIWYFEKVALHLAIVAWKRKMLHFKGSSVILNGLR